MIHPKADVSCPNIDKTTNIWQFCVIFKNAVIGKECNICANCLIENDVIIGDRVTIKSGVQLWDGCRVEDDVFIGPNVTFTNDPYPKSKAYQQKVPLTTIKKGASIGANATILPGIDIGEHSLIGAGAVVTNNVPPYAKVYGNPARIHGYIGADDNLLLDNHNSHSLSSKNIDVSGVEICPFNFASDMRGDLIAAEYKNQIPFEIKRFFSVFNVPNQKVRGQHAHKECHQLLVALKGSLNVIADDGSKRCEITLNTPNHGLWLKPGVWGIQYKYSEDAVLLVLASHEYDADDYIRDYNEFKKFKHIS
jgi:acetyltransferase-like isoleucine patch superfamily enzyme/dTDP-4-dehydrorhamnose 3,5-epimerase-like enzyme